MQPGRQLTLLRCCAVPGCPNKVERGRCARHRQADNLRYETVRPVDHEFYHSPTWRRLRAVKLRMDPLCEPCEREGFVVRGVGVNHVRARRDGGSDTLDNLETCCARHLNAADTRGLARRRAEGVVESTEVGQVVTARALDADKGRMDRSR